MHPSAIKSSQIELIIENNLLLKFVVNVLAPVPADGDQHCRTNQEFSNV
jgi:hypothetical protein